MTRYVVAEPFTAADLEVGDRIDPAQVAPTIDGIGSWPNQHDDAEAVAHLGRATLTHGLGDIHSAILVDGDSGVMVRAERHDSQAAWSQHEADWKVRGIGCRVAVTDAEIEHDTSGEFDDVDDVAAEAETWANVVLQDRALGVTDYADDLELDGRRLELLDPWGPKIVAAIELE